MKLSHRPRRLRSSKLLREMVAETKLSSDSFVYPYFVEKGNASKTPIEAMPGVNRFGVESLLKDVEAGLQVGINKILLFGVGDSKSPDAESSASSDSIVPTAIQQLKKAFGDELFITSDVCVCAYTDHGHCGIIHNNEVHNDQSLALLAQMSLTHAEAGVDMVAPSDMMDGRVAYIRDYLDDHNFETLPIMSYSTKFASAYYGPFRDAADSAPQQGDRRSYQMDLRNEREALKEALMDSDEGADILMVKPALAYLDIIKTIKENTLLPLACYNVSGEYAMVKAAAAQGYIDERSVVMENMMAFVRAGADIIISYHTHDILHKNWL